LQEVVVLAVEPYTPGATRSTPAEAVPQDGHLEPDSGIRHRYELVVAQRKTLTEKQVEVLRWIGNGWPEGVMQDDEVAMVECEHCESLTARPVEWPGGYGGRSTSRQSGVRGPVTRGLIEQVRLAQLSERHAAHPRARSWGPPG
jgi:hypothetical protein